ncbi:MAG: GNAT family N-acetyltransferase [Xanthomonadales bacterium]|nr:GNAT family N-acetyltransferase [Xanthomonadales bacterium]
MEYLRELGLVALGSRFKALSDQLYQLADQAYSHRQVPVQGRWFPLLRLLHDRGPQSIGEVALAVGQSHSAISQLAARLSSQGLVEATEDPQDRRCRRLSLTAKSRDLIRQAKPVWRAISQTLEQRTQAAELDLLASLAQFEGLLEPSLDLAIAERAAQISAEAVTIVPFEPALREHFYRLNAEWLQRYFYIEEIDHRVLSHPEAEILEPGGAIFFARIGEAVVGTCALLQSGKGIMELSKMGVDPNYQGLGIGRALIEAAIAEFQGRGGDCLFLETNSKLAPAIGLYESVGFERQAQAKPDSHYVRSDVYMIWKQPVIC